MREDNRYRKKPDIYAGNEVFDNESSKKLVPRPSVRLNRCRTSASAIGTNVVSNRRRSSAAVASRDSTSRRNRAPSECESHSSLPDREVSYIEPCQASIRPEPEVLPLGLTKWDEGFFVRHRYLLYPRSALFGTFIFMLIALGPSFVLLAVPGLADISTCLSSPFSLLMSDITFLRTGVYYMLGQFLLLFVVSTLLLLWIFRRHHDAGDPYGVRTELLISLPAHLLPALFWLLYDPIAIASNRKSCTTMGPVILVLSSFFMVWWINLYPYSLVLNRAMKTKRMSHESMQGVLREFQHLLHQSEGFHLFSEFLSHEWSSENLLFLQEVQLFKRLKTTPLLRHESKRIWLEYIQPGARFQINLPSATCEFLRKVIEHCDTVTVKEHESHLDELKDLRGSFDKAERDVRFPIFSLFIIYIFFCFP